MFQLLKGDKVLWGILALLAIFSFLPVFSASSNLVYVVGKGTPWGYLIKHFVILVIGFVLMYSVHKIPFHYFKGISLLMLPVIIFPYAINFSGLFYLIPALILTLYYNFTCYDLYKHKKNKFDLKKAKKVFGYSILYLFLIFVLFLVDNLI